MDHRDVDAEQSEANPSADRTTTRGPISALFTKAEALRLGFFLALMVGASYPMLADQRLTGALSAAHAEASRATAGANAGANAGASVSFDDRCERCHQFSPGLSHPVGIVASGTGRGRAADLPLDMGRVTCLTCHDESAARPHGEGRAGRAPDPMLRRESVESLCAECHQQPGRDLKHVHAMGLLKAHLDTPTGGARFGASGGEAGIRGLAGRGDVDGETASCLSCHDGTVASDVGEHVQGGRRSSLAMDGPSSHPIGVVYKAAVSRDGIQLRAPATLDRRIRLFDQRVGCGSCHSLYSRHQDHIVFSNDRSALCLGCHRM